MSANLKSGFWLARKAEAHLEKTKYVRHLDLLSCIARNLFAVVHVPYIHCEAFKCC